MKKRPGPALNSPAFSIASQFTGPPFSVMLESAELRRHLMEEIVEPLEPKVAQARARKATAKKSVAARKVPAKRPKRRSKK